MRLGGRMQAAIEVLSDLETRRRPASQALKDWGLSHRFAGSGDRAAIGNLVYDSLRKKASQSWRMNDDSPAALVHATLFGQWEFTPEQLTETLKEDRFAPEPITLAQISAWLDRNLTDAADHVRADIPQWCAPAFETVFGNDWVAQGVALAERPPLDLRANSLKAGREKVLKQLSRFKPRPSRFAPDGIRIPPGSGDARLPNVQAEAGYQKGWFEIQDEGSQLAALLAGAKPGEQVLDFCAGAGGKTLSLSAAMENRGQIHAYDADRNRLAPIHERIKRAGTRNAQVHNSGSDLSALVEKMDCVLVDAPCSGSGTWRRRPDAKWRLSEANLAERIAEQDAVLADAARFVAPGGRLIYVTCSLLPVENAERITRFLETNPQFQPVAAQDCLPALRADANLLSTDGSMLQLSPRATGTDGFFIATLMRT